MSELESLEILRLLHFLVKADRYSLTVCREREKGDTVIYADCTLGNMHLRWEPGTRPEEMAKALGEMYGK